MAYYNGNGSNNTYTGGSASDTIYGNNGNDILSGGGGNDYIDGGNNSDTLSGGDGNDQIFGGSGTDTLEGGAGNDSLDGGSGVDTVSFSGAVNGIWVELNQDSTLGFARDGNLSGLTGTDSIANMENVIGSSFNDIIKGNNAGNSVWAGAGYDTVYASRGIDMLDGGAGGNSVNFSDISGFGVNVDLTAGTYFMSSSPPRHIGQLQ